MAKTTPIFETSTDSKTLAAVLAAATVGQIISYDELSKAIGRTVTASKLSTARYIVQREQRIVFGAVAGVGLKRLSDAEIVALSDSARDHLRLEQAARESAVASPWISGAARPPRSCIAWTTTPCPRTSKPSTTPR